MGFLTRRKRIQIPKEFITQSWETLKSNKILYQLPIFNLISTGILFFFIVFDFIQPLIYAGDLQTTPILITRAVIGIILLLLIPFLANIFNAATLIFCHQLNQGQRIRLSTAVSQACKHWRNILIWGLIQSIIGLALSLFENTHDAIGKIVAMLIGAAWGLLSFFVLPILIVENKAPIDAIKTSIETVKKIWGRRAIIRMGLIAIIFFVLILIGIAMIFIGFSIHSEISAAVITFAIIYLIAVLYTRQLLFLIIRLHLYQAVRNNTYTH